MADRLWRAQVTIPLDSALPEDAIVNTWHFDDDDDPVAAPDDTAEWIVQQMLKPFYQAIDGALFPVTVGSEATVKMYDMALPPETRELLFQDTFTIVSSGLAPLPGEVALCLSMKAADSPGVNPSRRRGRIYLGPLHQETVTITDSQARPDTIALDTVRDAAEVLMAGFEHPASPGMRLRWSIYSPTTDLTNPVGDAFNDVVSGWVDNAFDTQRRRGCAPTGRVTF